MKANLMTKKIEMTKSEAKEAGKLNSEMFHELRKYMEYYPGFEIQIKAPGKRKVKLNGLDYDYMREYIQKHDASQMETFKTLIAQDKKDKKDGADRLKAENFFTVRKWFLTTFPEIEEAPAAHAAKVQAILNKVA